jgi:glycosyltransferase involved in cell wall biosynthesis
VPSVSVIIPAYNVDNYIPQAIESVLAQSYADFELIVVDDGSTDDTAEKCASFGDAIKYHYQKNAGVSCARNKGVGLAKSEWIAFLDADDYWYPDKLEKQMSVIEGYHELDLVTANYYYLLNDDHVTSDAFSRNSLISDYLIRQPDAANIMFTRDKLKDFLAQPFGHPSTTIFRKTLYEQVGGYSSRFSVAEDVHFLVRYLAASRSFGAVLKPLAVYRIRQASATRSNNARGNQQTLAVYKDLLASVGECHSDLYSALEYRIQTARLDLIYEMTKAKRRGPALWEALKGLVCGLDSRFIRVLPGIIRP